MLAAGLPCRIGESIAEPHRTVADISTAGGQISALCDGEQNPPQRVGIIVPIREIGGQRAFDRLVAAECAIEDLRDGTMPVTDHRLQFEECAEPFSRVAERFPTPAQRPEADCEAFHVAEYCRDARLGGREALDQGGASRRKTVWQDEWLSHRSSPNLVDRARRHPFDGVEDADAGEDGMLRIDRIQRVTGFVEGGFDHQIAESVGRRRTTDRCVALDEKRLAAGPGDERRRREPAEARADYDDVVPLGHRPYPSPLDPGNLLPE
jgi:hypothetical protein